MKRLVKCTDAIFAMSVIKSKGESILSGQEDRIGEHTTKLVLYSDVRPDDINGWKKSIAEAFAIASSFTVKPNGKHFSAEKYFEYLVGMFGDERVDIRNALDHWQYPLTRVNPPYPERNITEENINKCQEYYNLYIQFCNMIAETTSEIPYKVFKALLDQID